MISSTVIPVTTNQSLVLSLIPSAIVIAIMFRWRADPRTALYATLRMLVQLILIGYVLVYLFDSDRFSVIAGVLLLMIALASWIAIRTLPRRDLRSYSAACIAITLASLPTLGFITHVVVGVEPWFAPRYLVPLAGMLFAGAMNTVSLAAERYQAEDERRVAVPEARRIALQTSMIPTVNSLFAVGLITLPGMMTGQILSGVSPLIAAKYQIVVMSMLFGAAGMAAAIYLLIQGRTSSRIV